MNVYLSINFLALKDGRPYTFNVPQANQDFSEIYEVLDEIKKQVKEMEQRNKDSQKEASEKKETSADGSSNAKE